MAPARGIASSLTLMEAEELDEISVGWVVCTSCLLNLVEENC
jgi:hypothetical protein